MIHTMNQEQKVALISGAFGYVGRAVAKHLAEGGFTLVLLYTTTTDEEVARQLKNLPGTGHCAYRCDLTKEDEVKHVIEMIQKKYGALTVCVHAAGLKPERKKITATTTESLRKQLEVHVIGAHTFLTHVAPHMKQDGVIVGITTIGILVSEATKSLGGYVPAKYALHGILTMLRDEVHSRGIRVYSLAPGFMAGGMNQDIPNAFVDMVRAKSVTKTITTGEDIAKEVLDLYNRSSPRSNDFTIPLAREYGM